MPRLIRSRPPPSATAMPAPEPGRVTRPVMMPMTAVAPHAACCRPERRLITRRARLTPLSGLQRASLGLISPANSIARRRASPRKPARRRFFPDDVLAAGAPRAPASALEQAGRRAGVRIHPCLGFICGPGPAHSRWALRFPRLQVGQRARRRCRPSPSMRRRPRARNRQGPSRRHNDRGIGRNRRSEQMV